MRHPSRRPSGRKPSFRGTTRRRFLRVGGGATAVALAGCVGGGSPDAGTGTTGEAATETSTTSENSESTADGTTTEDAESEHVAWKRDFDHGVRLGPALAGETLYVGDSSGVLRALDPRSGEERWQFATDGSFFFGTGADRSPVLADGTLFAVSGNRSGSHGGGFAAYAVDAASGEKQWSVAQEAPKFLSLFGVAGGRAFVGTSDDALGAEGETLRALDAATGEAVWTGEVGDSRGASVTDDAAFVAASSRLDGFDASDGAHRFGREFPGTVLGPEVGDNVVYAGFREGRDSGALALDPQSGEERWRVDDWFVTSMLTGGDGPLYVGGERVASFASDGTERWRYDAGGLLSDGALAGGSLFVGGSSVTALSTADGTATWSNPVDAEFGVVDGASEEVVAVRRENGTVLDAFDAGTGDVRFTFDVGGKRLSSVAVGSDTVYAASDAGAVYALEE